MLPQITTRMVACVNKLFLAVQHKRVNGCKKCAGFSSLANRVEISALGTG